jgi:hypothetical protein
MSRFTALEEESAPQASGGPPRKHRNARLVDRPQFPPIRPRCFGCSQPVVVAEISRHILDCDRVLARDLTRFKTALAEFKSHPRLARAVVEEFVNRVRLNCGLAAGDRPR